MTERLNLSDDLRAAARDHPEKIALIHGEERVTYSDLERRAGRIAAGLYKIGIRTGDRVAIAIANTPWFVAVHYGCLKAGAVSVPLHPRMRASDLRKPLVTVSPRAIVAGESVAGEVMAAGPHSAPVFVIGKHPTARPFDEIYPDSPPPDAATGAGDPAVIAHTSGSTGPPKPATLTHGNLAASLDQLERIPAATVEVGDVVYGVIPLSNVYGLNVVLGLGIRKAATILLDERFDPARSLRSVAVNEVTVLPAAPPIFEAWLDSQVSKAQLSRVRFAVSGGSGLSPRTIERFRDKFGIEIWEGYGLTEASSAVATTRMAEQRPGSIGKVLADQQLRLVGEGGVDVLLGDPGEIWVRGPNVFKGYWGNEVATKAAFAGDWLRTGDIAYQDEDGYLWLVDPETEVIEISGFKIYPKEVEEALMEHPAVAEAAVVGEADTTQGQRVKAFVVLVAGSNAGEKDLIVHCTKLLARFKVPSRVEFLEALPRLESGQIVRRLLKRGGR